MRRAATPASARRLPRARQQSSTAPLTYYSAWFCPFAHRATLALEHHADVVPYAWEEALGWERRAPTGDEAFDATERDDWWYHWKSPGLLEANPLGMVPTLVADDGRAVTESVVAARRPSGIVGPGFATAFETTSPLATAFPALVTCRHLNANGQRLADAGPVRR